jgi:hypothetical protein
MGLLIKYASHDRGSQEDICPWNRKAFENACEGLAVEMGHSQSKSKNTYVQEGIQNLSGMRPFVRPRFVYSR